MIKRQKKRAMAFPDVVVFLIFYFGMFLRLRKLALHELWFDEFWSLEQMKGTFFDMIRHFSIWEYCPYLSGDFFLVFPFFKMFGFHKWGLAIPHILLTLFGFYLLSKICRIFFRTQTGTIVTFLIVSFNATLITHATEIRVYAVLPTLTLAAFLLVRSVLAENRNMPPRKLLLADSALIVIILFHAYGVLLVLTSFFYWVWELRHKRIFRENMAFFVKHALIIAAVTVPVWCLSLFTEHASYASGQDTIFRFIPDPTVDPIGFLKGVVGNLIGYKPFYVFLAGFLGLFCLPYPLREKGRQVMFLLIMVVVPVGLILVSDIRSAYWFVQRQFIFTIPFFAIFLGWLWDSAVSWGKKWRISRAAKVLP